VSAIAIRPAGEADAAALAMLYNHYIRNTTITFDIEEKSVEERRAWLAGFSTTGRYRCLVAQRGANVIGWASSHRFSERAAYDPSVLTSVYLAPAETGRGLGGILYAALFEALATEDIHRAYALITRPNPVSEALHRRFGFRELGVATEAGRKFGRYWDVAWYEKAL
jgi:phosphinothricin acetyltransferase